MTKIIAADKSIKIISDFYKTMMKSYTKHTLNYKKFSDEAAKDNTSLLPIICKGNIQATCALIVDKTNSEGKPYYASVHRVTVLPKLRGKGLGTRANANALKYAKQVGCRFIHCSAVINVERTLGGGNRPNLRELKICVNKLGYLVTGFRLTDLPDFSRTVDRQYTSTAVLWRPLSKRVKIKSYFLAKSKLISYYKGPDNFKVSPDWRGNCGLHEENGKRPGIARATSNKIENFANTPYLPSFFLPFYGPKNETIYFGYKYETVLTRASNGWNIADLNYSLLEKCISDNDFIDFSKKVQKHIIKQALISYSNPAVKKNNI